MKAARREERAGRRGPGAGRWRNTGGARRFQAAGLPACQRGSAFFRRCAGRIVAFCFRRAATAAKSRYGAFSALSGQRPGKEEGNAREKRRRYRAAGSGVCLLEPGLPGMSVQSFSLSRRVCGSRGVRDWPGGGAFREGHGRLFRFFPEKAAALTVSSCFSSCFSAIAQGSAAKEG